ncbi:FmdB family zinc ribbon protein [Chitinasiproducens palmae]|uniref:Putative regulatory protein, FmdB family n=1 Tax=Chitinasiproducens palmae TaxID=1770053 RepID=A0A1H2PNJ3_9BURK|nr:FmdB family zinc ribbon protein [Chitinasiproducens palmae]SDV48166.1 putative regulatory protein, FmdB family [Chitinasiproducens palmae]
MPIYAYRCESCGFEKDVLQKMSDAPLTVCPQCHADAFRKQVTAAGFQLKGSGWYVTDFRDSGKKSGSGNAASTGKTEPAKSEGGKNDASGGDAGKSAAPGSASGTASAGGTSTGSGTSGTSGASGTSSSTPTTSA